MIDILRYKLCDADDRVAPLSLAPLSLLFSIWVSYLSPPTSITSFL